MADHGQRRAAAIALTQVADYLEQREIPYSLMYGTLLGAARHRGFVPHDEDVDLLLARQHSPLIYDMAAHFSVQTHFNTPPWDRHSALQRLQFPGALSIDAVNEEHEGLADVRPLLSGFLAGKETALTRLPFCGRLFFCLANHTDVLHMLYGPDCLTHVDAVQRRQGRDYRQIPRREKLPLARYNEIKRHYQQPDLNQEVIPKPYRFRLGLLA